MKRLCVFCGSSPGSRPQYVRVAEDFGRLMAREGLGLVYGGGGTGLMGALADAVLANGGRAIGVIPHSLATKELAHAGLTEQHIVDSMHERKALMADRADGFLALPGGLGTFEEIMEVATWAQLGIHRKPCALLNAHGYYDPLIALLDHAVTEQFLKPIYRQMILTDSDPRRLLARMRAYEPPPVARWVTRAER